MNSKVKDYVLGVPCIIMWGMVMTWFVSLRY
jgi:hypothetical protein